MTNEINKLSRRLEWYKDHHLVGILVTPRDLGKLNPSVDKLGPPRSPDHRYKGYPNSSFVSPRSKQATDENRPPPPLEKFHGVQHFLDTRNPKIHGPANGFQYGSDSMPDSKQEARPFRYPELTEKSSADQMKAQQQRMQVEEGLKHLQEEKRRKIQEREDEKRQDMEMLKSYNPWGRPGYGAPTEDSKKQRLDLEPRKASSGHSSLKEEYGDFHANFGRPGAGAPLRTDSGKLRTELKTDTSIRFQDTKGAAKVFELEVRYKQDGQQKEQYSKDLDLQIKKKNYQDEEARIAELKKELEMLKHDPYGKPGAGAPNRTVSGSRVLVARTKINMHDPYSLTSTDNTRLPSRTLSDGNNYDPWGKGAGHPKRDHFGDARRQTHSYRDKQTNETPRRGVVDEEKGHILDTGARRGGAGAPVQTESGNIQTRMPITMTKGIWGDTNIREEVPGKNRPAVFSDDPEYQIYDPWGKAGAGAPLRDKDGRVEANVYGKLQSQGMPDEKNRKGAETYRAELQREMEEQRKNKDEMKKNFRVEAGEFTEEMRKGQVGKPKRDPETGLLLPQHLPMSDVSRFKVSEARGSRGAGTGDGNAYHTELEKAATTRRQNLELDRLKTKQEARQHQAVMDNFWGKPGAGAPMPAGTKKANLDDILYSPRKQPVDYYAKRTLGAETTPQPHNYIRNTVNSTANNGYEFHVPQKREAKHSYQLVTPYASNPEEVF